MRSRANNEQGSVITSALLVPDREGYLFCYILFCSVLGVFTLAGQSWC
jgi:hypothetical protein